MNKTELATDDQTVMAELITGEIDTQIATAKRYPRDLRQFKASFLAMVTSNQSVAEACMYSLRRWDKEERRQKIIEGPGARFAECGVYCWGNVRCGARILGERSGFVVAQGAFHDLQTNVAITYEVSRRITTKNGKRFSDDMIGVASSAALSIAFRNCVLKGIPEPLWRPIYDEARKTAIGDQKTMATRLANMFSTFHKMGQSKESVMKFLGVTDDSEITGDHLVTLLGIRQAHRNGEMDVEEAFRDSSRTASTLAAELDKKPEAKTGPTESSPEETPQDDPPHGLPDHRGSDPQKAKASYGDWDLLEDHLDAAESLEAVDVIAKNFSDSYELDDRERKQFQTIANSARSRFETKD